MLAKANQQLVIYFMNAKNIPDDDSEDENTGGVMLKVKVIDHENLESNAAVQTYVENLKTTSIEQMKLRVCVMVLLYQFSLSFYCHWKLFTSVGLLLLPLIFFSKQIVL